MFEELDEIVTRYEELGRTLSEGEVVRDRKEFVRLSREYAEVGRVVEAYQAFRETERQLVDARELLEDGDPEVRELAAEEAEGELIALLDHWSVDVRRAAIVALGALATPEARSHLEDFRHSLELGRAAKAAIKAIRRRHAARPGGCRWRLRGAARAR